MKPIDAVNEKNRIHGTPNDCYSCKHSYNDVEEGWNCKKYDATITFSNGSTMACPGQACDRAYENDCKGNGFEKAVIPGIIRKHPGFFIPIWSILMALVTMIIVNCAKH